MSNEYYRIAGVDNDALFNLPASDSEHEFSAHDEMAQADAIASQLDLDNDVRPLFYNDMDMLHGVNTPSSVKADMLAVIIDTVIHYRSRHGNRAFPPEQFYEFLLENNENADFARPLACRCAKYLRSLSPEDADAEIEYLRNLRLDMSQGQAGGQEQSASQDGRASRQNQPSEAQAVDDTEVSQAPAPERGSHREDENSGSALKEELNKPCSFAYRGLIQDINHYVDVEKEYLGLIRHETGDANADETWPLTSELQRAYVAQVVDAIMDVSDFEEKKEALKKQQAIDAFEAARTAAAETEFPVSLGKRKRDHDKLSQPQKLSVRERTYADPKSTPEEVLQVALHHKMSDVEIEVLAMKTSAMNTQQGWNMQPQWAGNSYQPWEKFDSFGARWAEVCQNMRNHKVMVRSLMVPDWATRLTAAPRRENKLKQGNKKVNAKRDLESKLGRETLKRQKTEAGDSGDSGQDDNQ
ncbi:hypothetical protein CkaCkLH20_02074 [Colletotrichum karsti]|uniref:Uncharacterized protein n=1 Tax=Colletotrichum karsti TaxID=1095194 RepID=A0A9P6IIK6_9PEZI|nr:uncharacterized protein CkaCkLH20_02074 [Colletotrichum karsti]KAF9880120.1 hypothetical protein CkaCkLH20_02074 [Colletotrichum karsti]